MHILYLHQHFVARSGTSGGRSHEFSKLLIEKGHRVTLITGAYHRSGVDVPFGRRVIRTTLDGIDLIVLNIPYDQKMGVLRRIISFIHFMVLSAWIALGVRNVDVVFATSTPLTIAVPGIIVSLLKRRRFVFEVRDLWPEIPIALGVLRNPFIILAARCLERIAYRMAYCIIALSPGMKAGIANAGVRLEKISVIPNSSDVELFRASYKVGLSFRQDHPEIGGRAVVGFAGAFGRVNGLDYVVQLAKFTHTLDPHICFVLAGEGSERQKIINLAQRVGVLDRNFFVIEPLPRSQLVRLLSAADMLASFFIPLPAMETNSANKFFDALAAGKPVLLNYKGWQAEIIENNGAGLVIDANDVEFSAQRLVKAMRDSDWLKKAGDASRRLGQEVFDRRLLAIEFEKVLSWAANG